MGAGKRAVVLDVSTLVHRSGVRPTGIDRVLLETALELCRSDASGVSFCRYDRDLRQYRPVPREAVLSFATSMRGDHSIADGNPTGQTSNPAPRSAAPQPRRDRRLAATRRRLRQGVGYAKRALGEMWHAAPALRQDLVNWNQRRSGCFSQDWDSSTTYVSLGIDFAHNDIKYLRTQRHLHGFHVAVMIYDLIPVFAPHLATRELHEYFVDLIETCDIAYVISSHAADDLRAFAQANGLPTPALVKVPLGSDLFELEARRPIMVPDGLEFLLTIGTVTLRKNHQLLLDVWLGLMTQHGAENVPTLVIAGTAGGLSEETISRIRRDPDLVKRTIWISDASDEEIVWLYKHCKFTLFPSFYEGWGLPVSESHDFGKVCIASDRSSLPEAGGGLALHLDPYDRSRWRDEIWRHWTDSVLLESREALVLSNHRRVTPSDTVHALIEASTPGRMPTSDGPEGTTDEAE